MRRALGVAALAALVLPATAFAHASLRHESPGFRERLEAREIREVAARREPVGGIISPYPIPPTFTGGYWRLYVGLDNPGPGPGTPLFGFDGDFYLAPDKGRVLLRVQTEREVDAATLMRCVDAFHRFGRTRGEG